MFSKVIHKFYLIGGLLGLLFLVGYAQLAFFLHHESQGAMRRREAATIENEIHFLEYTFFKLRFWEKTILSQGHPEADKKFGSLMEQMNRSLGILKTKSLEEDVKEELRQISRLIIEYERIFNQIIQLRTEQRLGQTLFDSNYQSLISNIFRSNEISLLKPVFNLSHFQQNYLYHHRESEYQAVKVVMGSLENRLRRKDLMDERLKGYIEAYKKYLDNDFFLEKEIQNYSNHFDETSIQLTSHFLHISEMAEKVSENEIITARRLRSRLNQSFIISMALATIGILLILVFMARRIVHPIRGIAEVARDVRSGNLEARFVSKKNHKDEVVQLGWNLNDMLEALDKKNEQLVVYQKELEDKVHELEAAQEELVRKEKLAVLGALAGGVGHELRNPLGVISNAVYYLQTVLTDVGETTRQYLQIIADEVLKSDKIVSDLLGFSRIKPAERQDIGISEMITRVFKKHPPPEGVKLTTAMDSELPPVFVDHRQIDGVLVNLVTNAYQAMPKGGELNVRAKGTGDKVRLSIEDNGGGISKEAVAKIFEPLFTTKARGIGLGLSVSKALLEANGASIEVESEEGRGSIFTVMLPTREVGL